MDSGNSGSLQSSSGGDDEFDSRGGVDSSPLAALLRPAPSPSAAAFSLHGSLYGLQEFAAAAPPQRQQQQHQASLWSGSFTGAAGASSSSSPRASGADQGARQQAETPATALGSAAPPPPRGSRKRTRASRRAPTTVLTTDTSNFRAMVQEFTGIPSPPFAASVGGAPAATLRTRFDHIFPPSSSVRSAAGNASSLPPYLLRPFAQKLPSAPCGFPPFTSSSSSSSALSSSIGVADANVATGATTTAGASSNLTATAQAAAAGGAADTFQLTSSSLLRLQDPSSYLSFQNLLDSQSSAQSIFGAASGFAQEAPRLHEPAPSEFLAGIGSRNLGLSHGGLIGSEGLHLHPRSDVHHGSDELFGMVASGGSCKLNSTHAGAATSSLAAASGDKPPDAGAPGTSRPERGEGLDPWTCTSE